MNPIHTKKIITLKSIHTNTKHFLQPSFILKNNYIKKGYLQTQNTHITRFIVIIFKKITIFIKTYTQTPNISMTPIHTKKIITLKDILTNLEIPRTLFCLSPFPIFKKCILTNLKIPRTIFCLSSFQIFKKAYLQI